MAISPYQSLFGMGEMEAALEYLLDKAAATGVQFCDYGLKEEEIIDKEHRTGFLHLLCRGYFYTPTVHKWRWYASQALIKRMREHAPEVWGNLPDVKLRVTCELFSKGA